MIKKSTLRQLRAVDWDFPGAVSGTTSSLHWYPGSFTASTPATLIQALSRPGDLVFDPYCGIGTTSVEAIRLDRRAWAVEHHPVASLVAFVTSGLVILEAKKKGEGEAVLAEVADLVSSHTVRSRQLLFPFFDDARQHGRSPSADKTLDRLMRPRPRILVDQYLGIGPSWGGLSMWIAAGTLRQIRKVWRAIRDAEISDFARLVALVMLSDRLRSLSSQTRSWGHIADRVYPTEFVEKEVGAACTRWLKGARRMLGKTQIHSRTRPSGCRAWSTQYDWTGNGKPAAPRTVPPRLLLTSPPYGDAIDYARAHRLSLHLLGHSDEGVDRLAQSEIGARCKRFGSSSIAAWAEEVTTGLEKQLPYVADDGFVALVLPHKEAGRDVGRRELHRCLVRQGWTTVFEAVRSINQQRARQSWTSILREYVRVYSRD